MAHFAELDENNIVLRVVVIANEDCEDGEGNESESVGVSFCQTLFGEDTTWKQTSYNNNIRKNYAHPGMKYYSEHDFFADAEGTGDSWTLNTTTGQWEPPIPSPEPTEEVSYWVWDEDVYNADTASPKTQGWISPYQDLPE